MSRKRILDPTVQKNIQLSKSLVARVEAQPAMRDPLTGKVRYGAWRHLLETHLRRWLAAVEHRPEAASIETPALFPEED